MIINPYAFGVAYDPDAQAFFTASGLTGATNLTAINNLVVALKGFGIWTKMKAIYPFVGGTAALHKWNLKDPQDTNAAFRLTFNGGWTHTSTGATPNGTNGFADTFLNPSLYSTNHLSYYSRKLAVGVEIEMGCYRLLPDILLHNRVAQQYVAGALASFPSYTTTTDARGFWLGCMRATNDRECYLNGVSQGTNITTDAIGFPAFNIFIGARNAQGGGAVNYSTKECAFSSIGDGLTDTEAANLYLAVQNYNTTLSRQV